MQYTLCLGLYSLLVFATRAHQVCFHYRSISLSEKHSCTTHACSVVFFLCQCMLHLFQTDQQAQAQFTIRNVAMHLMSHRITSFRNQCYFMRHDATRIAKNLQCIVNQVLVNLTQNRDHSNSFIVIFLVKGDSHT